MKKHLTRAFAALLVLAMVLTMLPAMAFATEPGEGASFFNGLPTDGSYGTIYSCGEGYSYVIGYDIGEGNAPALAVEKTEDGEAIKALPDGAMVIKFVQTGDDWYFQVGNKYLVLKDIDASNKEKLVLSDTAEAGAKWSILPDVTGAAGVYQIMNAEYKWNGRSDVYLEQYNGQKFCGYSKWKDTTTDNIKHYQFRFLTCSADPDGRVGERVAAAGKPENGDKVVIYNEAAHGVFGQQTGPEAPKQNLLVAAANLNSDGTLSYDKISDGGLIFDVTVSGNYYTFKTGEKYLAMTENYTNDQGKTANDESLILVDAESDYTQWTLSEINGGWLIKNKTAVWGSNGIVIEFFGDLFCGYSYYAGDDGKYAMNFYKIDDKYGTGYVVNPAITLDAPTPAIGTDCQVRFTVDDLNELKELLCSYSIDGAGDQEAVAEMNGKVGTFVIPAEALEGASKLTVKVYAKDAMDLEIQDQKTVDVKDEPLILELFPAANTATGDEKQPEIGALIANCGSNPTVELELDGAKVTPTVTADKVSYKPAAALTEGKHSVALTITRTDGKKVSKNWSFFVGQSGETLYFGQVHAHTAEYSDGAGTLEQAYEHAHEVADLDYIIITDHSNYFDTTKTATYTSYYNLDSLTMNAAGTVSKWEEARATADYYNKLYDDFICIYGYEMTWSGGPGHTNSFNTYGTLSRNNSVLNNKTNYAGMLAYDEKISFADRGLDETGKAEAKTNRYAEYSAEMKAGSLEIKRVGEPTEVTGVNATKYIPFDEDGKSVPVVSQFNHPGTTFGTFGDFMGFTAQRDDQLNLVEVGNGEGKVGGSSYFPSYSEYDKALGMGWHLAPTNNQDNHKGNWGDSNTCRDVILTDDFSEIGIYRALDARRVYATEDQNLEIYYELKVGDTWYKLGDIAAVDADNQPEKVTVKVSVNDPDSAEKIGTLYVIGAAGKTLYSTPLNGSSDAKEFELDNTGAYYYIKIVEADGDIAVTAPVWTRESVPANVDVKTDASVAAQGVEENVLATFTNGSETEPMTIKSYKIEAEGKVIEEKTEDEIVAAGSVKELKVPFTPAATNPETTKTYPIKATFTYVYKDKEYTNSKEITETSYPPSQMTYIGLDSGHKNFYVSGDYANCDTSFIQICADHGIICEYIKEGEMTKENLAKYKLVVISTPRISEEVRPPVFTEAELAALKDYTDNGGSIINLGKSDRYDYSELGEDGKDTYKYASATLNNSINEAIGANARFVRGIVVDPEKKANEAYRIYFDGAELLSPDHPFTKAIFRATNGEYQWYNGTGVVVEEGKNEAEYLVRPYDSSWVASYKDNFTGSAYEPDYENDTVMAKKGEFGLVSYEKLAGGGFLVCGGAAFISTYDLKTDTEAAQQYENYQMVLNILEYVKNGNKVDEPEITPIADVHKGKVNQEFTIEGWITANASGYDQDTAFFDCIYVQDETRGINLFPVAGYYYIGEKVQAHGAVTYYCGEIELNLSPDHNGSLKIVDNDLNIIEPAKVSCKVAMADNSIGNLMQISGVVKDIHRTEGVVDYIYVDDGSGEIGCLFINNYIQKDYKGLDDIEVGMSVTGVGIGSRDVDENDTTGGTFIKRLRVRSREEITAYFDPCAAFTDVNRNSWYHEGVDYAIANGIMNGTTATTFAPNATMTRAMLVTVLYRMEGEPEVTGKTAFTDVKAGSYYEKPVIWANANGIVNGTSDTTFSPNSALTREQLAALVYRYANYSHKDTSARADLSKFPDANRTSNYAVEPMQWAVAAGLIGGSKENGVDYLQPKNKTTRGQVATILMRYAKMDIADADDIVILYTNDVHCGVDNSASSFGYAGLAAYRDAQKELHDYVGLVDAGDFIQGEAIGSLSKGEAIITLMNAVGYDAATLGNHEFDYGVDNIVKLVGQAEFPIVTSNWTYTGPEGAADVADLDPYVIVEYGDTKIAYVGITTPESLAKSTPTYFQDAEGNWIYDFANDKTGEALYAAVQKAVDAARAENVDYVVALAHLGIDEGSAPWRSTDVIRNTTGIDVMLDGHSHSVIPNQMVPNKDGDEVPLSSTGTKLANIGVLTIKEDGTITTELVGRKDFDGVDEDVAAKVQALEDANAELLNTKVIDLAIDLTISNPDRLDAAGNPVRAVRYQETNLGDVCADAYVYASNADIAFVNGGGVRADIKAGEVTFNDIIKVHPFGNELVVVKATGQQILDALEMSSRFTTINDEGLVDGECGGFLQVSGLKYTIFTGTKSTVTTDAAAMFESVAGERRVGDVQVLNKTTGAYEPIDPAKTYTLASHNYMLKEGGDGLNMFMKCEIIRDGGMLDNEVLINYFQSDDFAQRLADGKYNTWSGEGRITVSKDAAVQPVNKEALQQSVDAAETLTEADYSAESWAVLAAALAEAKAVLAKEDATQEEVDAAAAALDAAVEALKPAQAEDEVIYELTTVLKDGDKVVIYHPTSGNALGNTLTGKKITAVAVTVADNQLTLADGAAVYTVEMVNETDFYLKQPDGKYLTTGATGNSMSLEETPNECSKWKLEVLDADAGTVGIRSVGANYNGNYNQALEYYNGFTTYGWRDNNNAYIFQLYKEVKVEKSFQLKTVLKDADQLVIYHPTSGNALGDTLTGKKITAVAVTVADGVLEPADGVAVYTVEMVNETDFYLKQPDGKYLTTGATGNSMSLEETPNECSKWKLEVLDADAGTVGIRSVGANYNGNYNQALEYYNGFTTYGWRDNNNAYIFQLYVLTSSADGHKADHKTVAHEEKPATCTEIGYTAGVWCDDCGKWVEGHEEIAALGHIDENGDKVCDRCGGTIYTLVTELVDGDKIVIVSVPNSMALTGTAAGTEAKPALAGTAQEIGDGSIAVPAGSTAAFFEVEEYTDATYGKVFYLKLDGKYLTTTASNNLALADAPVDGSKWTVKALSDGMVGLQSVVELDNNKLALEYYSGNFTTYKWQNNNSAYYLQLFH